MNERGRVKCGGSIVWLLCLCALALPAVHWYRQHRREAEEREAYQARAAANLADLQSAFTRLKDDWHATDGWENQLSAENATMVPYTANLEHALMMGQPLMFYGTVTDVHTEHGQDASTVEVKVHGRVADWRLQLALNASLKQTATILHNESFRREFGLDEMSKVCIFVASIDNVERVGASDKQGNDNSHFLAHGTLHDAYASQVYGAQFFH